MNIFIGIFVISHLLGMFLYVAAAEFKHTVDKKEYRFDTFKATMKSIIWPVFVLLLIFRNR